MAEKSRRLECVGSIRGLHRGRDVLSDTEKIRRPLKFLFIGEVIYVLD